MNVVVGLAVLALSLAVLVVGLRAPRTRILAMIGLVPAGCALGAFAWSFAAVDPAFATRLGAGLTAITAGIAHGVGFSILPLPARRATWRFVLVPLGMWCGTFASIWFFFDYRGIGLVIPLGVLATAVVASWVAAPFLARERGTVESGSRLVPSVRFPCPRCGTRVDWANGIWACTDCGLFVRVQWPAPPEAASEPVPEVPRGVRFACPQCGRRHDWPCGVDACPACRLTIAVHWNVHSPSKRR